MFAAVACAAVVGGGVGALLKRHLQRRRYLVPDDGGGRGSRHRWVLFGLAIICAGLGARLAADRMWGLAPAYLALAVVGVALAAIDLDVHRLPDALTLRTMPLIFLTLCLATVVHPGVGGLLAAVGSGLGALVVFGLLVLAVPEGMGLGDAKLAALVALPLGWWGWPTAILGLALGFVVGGIWAAALMVTRRADRHTHFAFGPSILLGAWLTLLVTVPPG